MPPKKGKRNGSNSGANTAAATATTTTTVATHERRDVGSDDALSTQDSGSEALETVERTLEKNGVTVEEKRVVTQSADGLKKATEVERVMVGADGHPVHHERHVAQAAVSEDGLSHSSVSKHQVSSVSSSAPATIDLSAHHAAIQSAMAAGGALPLLTQQPRDLAPSIVGGSGPLAAHSFASAVSHQSSSHVTTTSHVTHSSTSHVSHSSSSSTSNQHHATASHPAIHDAAPSSVSRSASASHTSTSTTTNTANAHEGAHSGPLSVTSPTHHHAPAPTATHAAVVAPASTSSSSSSTSSVVKSVSSSSVSGSAPAPVHAPAPAPAPATTSASQASHVTTTTTRSIVSNSSVSSSTPQATPTRVTQSSTTYEYSTPVRSIATSNLTRIALTPQRIAENDPTVTEIFQRSQQARQTREQIASQSQKAISTITELLERSAASPARARSLDHSHLNCPICTSGGSLMAGPCGVCKEKDVKIAELESRIKTLEAQLALAHASPARVERPFEA